jgi:hypothetical protein
VHYVLNTCLIANCTSDRSSNERIVGYQEWLEAPAYEGKCDADIAAHTITSLTEVITRLKDA